MRAEPVWSLKKKKAKMPGLLEVRKKHRRVDQISSR